MYICYMMYTMYMYSINEFRKNMRKAFNDVIEGHQVIIQRYDQKFQLVNLDDKISASWQTSNENTLNARTLAVSANHIKDKVTQSMPLATAILKPKVIKTPAEAKDMVSDFKSFKDNDLCPHGFSKSARMCKKGCR